MDFAFLPFDDAKLDATEAAWRSDNIGESVFPGDINYALNVARKQSYNGELVGTGIGYGVFPVGAADAVAIVEVFVSQHGKRWLKMMSCTLRPSLQEAVYVNDKLAIDKALDAYGTALSGVLDLHEEHHATAVRIYGRHDVFLNFLKELARAVHEKGIGEATVDVQGRWLVVHP